MKRIFNSEWQVASGKWLGLSKLMARASWLALSALLLLPLPLLAVNPNEIISNKVCEPSAGAGAIGCAGKGIFEPGGAFSKGISTVIFLVGAISVLMIVIGGLRYVLSGGDSAGTKSAKDTILYAVIGLVIAILAYGVVGFVLRNLG